jgi:linoleate 8R-lipoxygenase/9,12-octadecadienoate 8-hydroperoxide 8R-isomerase
MSEGKETNIIAGLGNTISQVENVVAASLRPLPTATGDGTYVAESTQTGLVKDLGHVDFKDVRTLVEVVKSAATGEPVDDKQYIMERVIQVSSHPNNKYAQALRLINI